MSPTFLEFQIHSINDLDESAKVLLNLVGKHNGTKKFYTRSHFTTRYEVLDYAQGENDNLTGLKGIMMVRDKYIFIRAYNGAVWYALRYYSDPGGKIPKAKVSM